jgi:spore coat polysaccharide biosynthesis protein SpsF
MKTAAVIAARMGSTRLEKKAVRTLAGLPLTAHVIKRAMRLPGVSDGGGVVLAVPEGDKENELAAVGVEYGAVVFRGDEDDVLSRILLAAESVGAELIWRVTGDNPLIDQGVALETWGNFDPDRWDYAVMEDTPLGTTAELVTMEALRHADKLADTPRLREHPTLAMYENSGLFSMLLIPSPDKWRYPEWRFTIDSEEDLSAVEAIMSELGVDAGLGEIIPFLEEHPEIVSMNSGVAQQGWKELKERKNEIGQL